MQTRKRDPLLSITIKDFGPIAYGKIDVKPLTIFMGSNNSGKSYAALLIYSILRSEHQSMHDILDAIFNLMRPPHDSYQLPLIPESYDTTYDVNKAYEKFQKELQRNFASGLSQLVRFRQNLSTVDVSSWILQSKITISSNALNYPSNTPLNINVKTNSTDIFEPIVVDNAKTTLNVNLLAADPSLKEVYRILHDHVPLVYYLPASRQGILQSHKLLSSRIVNAQSYVGIEKFQVPKMSGAVADLLESLLDLPPKVGPLNKLANRLETSILDGNVRIRNTKHFPEISYKHFNHLVPLHRTSSMVSELTPLVLYTRYLIRPGSVLVVEEPEAHLHPQHQVALAKFIVDLVRNNVRVLITTHSPYLVEQIGNYLQAGGVADKSRLPDSKRRYINSNELSVYSFESDNSVTTINGVNVSEEDGIDQTQFVNAFEAISNHARMIEEL